MSDEEDAGGGWFSVSSAAQQAEMHLPGVQEPMDVVWVSGSAIAVAPRSNVPAGADHTPRNENPAGITTEPAEGSDGYGDSTDEYDISDSDTTLEYPLNASPAPIDIEEDQPQTEAMLNGNSVIIIERENAETNIVQEPNLVTFPEIPNVGIENPIIRLENPHYEPEAAKSPCRTPKAASKRSYGTMISEEDDGQTCPVCLDIWTSAGDHRLCSLKCGHLFGKSCIIRWLSMEKKKYCPQCNKKATAHDIRELYATKLSVMDSSEKTRLEKEIEEIKEQKKRLEMELMRSNLNMESYKEQLEQLKAKLANIENNGTKEVPVKSHSAGPLSAPPKFHLEKTLEIQEGSCRVCAYSPGSNMLIVSHQVRNQLFGGYGVKKIKKIGAEYYGNHFLYLHAKALRDLCFHPTIPNLLLSVSFDKTAKLSNIEELAVIKTFKTAQALWSCCWDADDPNIFYTGDANGVVSIFDVRIPGEVVSVINPQDDFGPVVSLRSAMVRPSFQGGLLCCRLNSVVLYEKTAGSEFNIIPLPALVGPFFSLSYNPDTQHILASCRPSEENPKVRHIYCELTGTSCRQVHTFCGGTRQTLISRSCFVKVNGESLVAAFQENTNTIELWSTATGARMQSIPVNDHILDLTSIQTDDKYFLGTVSDKLVRFFEAPCGR